MNKNEVYQICVVGDGAVGKTQIINRYVYGSYIKEYLDTNGLDYKKKKIQMDDGKIIKLKIWDTGGNERFRSVAKRSIEFAEGIILIYDVTHKDSFDNLDRWVRDIRENTSSKTPIFLAGNKKDDEECRIIKKEQGEKFAKENNLMFSECSAKTGDNIDNIFYRLVKAMMDKDPEYQKRIKEEIKKHEEEIKGKEFEEKKLNILKKYISF